MNVREDKKNNSLGLQIGKTSLNYCVPVLFGVTGRARRKKYFARCKVGGTAQQVQTLFPSFFSSNLNKRLTIHQRTWLIL